MLKIFALIFSFTSDVFNSHSPSRTEPHLSILDHGPDSQVQSQPDQAQVPIDANFQNGKEWVKPMFAAPPYNGEKIGSRKDWVVTCDSEADKAHSCDKLLDGDASTFWMTSRKTASSANVITVDLRSIKNVNGIAAQPRQDNSEEGNVAAHEIYVSKDGQEWGAPVSYGTWWTDRTEKHSGFETVPARYVRLVIHSDATSSSTTAIAEFNVYINPKFIPASPAGTMGIWGPTLNTPIVPITAFVDPFTNKVVMISSKKHDNFPQDRPAYTLTVIWDPVTQKMTPATVQDTHHNMFCPGISYDVEGRLMVSGGASGTSLSIFDGATNDAAFLKQWQSAGHLVYTRGYHASVLNADGRLFAIGGSWGNEALDPAEYPKDGEVYDPKTNKWTLLPGAQCEKMLTKDARKFRRDNHGWLFAWKNDTVLQAGPSLNMNWYTINDEGGWHDAGKRSVNDGTTDDEDAMCGQAVMFDAPAGKVLTFGGAHDYDAGIATNKAFLLTLGEPNSTVKVARAEPMAHNRTYASAVVLPDGGVLVAGGQFGVPRVFNDKDAVLQTEIWSPKTGHWSQLATNNIVRVYHSFTLLLPDATVLSGGGGLCGDSCDVNHFDAQVYTPPYLLTAEGKPATRPVILKTSVHEVKPGGTFSITTDGDVADASLVRYGSTTHAVNTDQRRIPLRPRKTGAGTYEVDVPGEGYVAIPGYWMLFVMNGKGTPSVSKPIKILLA